MKKYLLDIILGRKSGFFAEVCKFVLWILSFFYFMCINIRNMLYDAGILKIKKLEKPVISIGNITIGGVGKTPIVEFIAKEITKMGLDTAVLIRGYMDKENSGENIYSDEALVLNNNLPNVDILVCPDRIYAAQEFLKDNNTGVFILDDGFQHRKLYRDINIVAVDTTSPWGNGFLIPRGTLREPLKSLKRADIIILTKTDIGKNNVQDIRNRIKSICGDVFIAEAIHKPLRLVDVKSNRDNGCNFLEGKEVSAFCSIGNEGTFYKTITMLGAELKGSRSFVDHYSYKNEDIYAVLKMCEDNGTEILVTTRKDIVKLSDMFDMFGEKIQLMCLDINIEFANGREKIIERICNILQH